MAMKQASAAQKKWFLSGVVNFVWVWQREDAHAAFPIDLTYRLGCSDECRNSTMMEF